jgi:isopenicillin N synthase-like dioxygenase
LGSPIPVIDIGALFEARSPARDAIDAAILSAARDPGFLIVTGLPTDIPLGPAARAALLRIFSLGPDARRGLHRRKFAPENPNVYRGWFPLQPGNVTAKEGIDLGADVAHGAALVCADDPLREATPLPGEAQLPGWRAAVVAYTMAMERVAGTLMGSIARALGLPERFFAPAFHEGLSTLRLIRYPPRSPEELASCGDEGVWVTHAGLRRYLVGAAHTDSGFLTLLAQDGVPGLQARTRAGHWLDVPPLESGLAVNFGLVLERWCGGRIRATEHRVLGTGAERHSIPFFYEARADAWIRPTPLAEASSFEPFLFGDYLWDRITQFVEFRGMEAERRPRGRGADRLFQA